MLDRYLKNKGIHHADGLTRLSIIGNTGMGGLEYYPNHEMKENYDFDLDKYQEEANKILNKEETNID